MKRQSFGAMMAKRVRGEQGLGTGGVLFTTPHPLYLRPLDELLRASTSDLPSERSTMNKFVDDLGSWTEIYKDFRKQNPSVVRFPKELFPFSVPRRAIYRRSRLPFLRPDIQGGIFG